MRELSSAELCTAFGCAISDYIPEDIATVSATTGYTLGAFIKNIQGNPYPSSVTGLATAISSCQRTYKQLQGIMPRHITESPIVRMLFHLGCSIQVGLSERAPRIY
ncbi:MULTISPECIES: hypothetical protein [unclassified Bordetella]|uniref:hypothetical protein n=1 Tax=unclassified Bordetella TaxID=2630031 RepID=UPI0013274B22|nr:MULTISPECIES: hypothetical protein [unclassified Bordetella]MVW72580.1 hypothetical protein [Bordetella sp. 15P40C-2]MVW78508.1 hypothetical protein [Bordetella sp. 02P26C-1]